MRTPRLTATWLVYRLFLVSVLVVTAVIGFSELGQSLPGNHSNVVKAETLPRGEAVSAKGSISTYSWNLSDKALPLLTLPDHVGREFDLSLTFSMDQFQFPLFQSLNYNARAGKYLFMVIQGRRLEFINLDPVGEFEANDNAGVRLAEKGVLKLVRAADGTIYTFAPLANGELHCRQISDHNGAIINLKYTADASIASIVDTSGRIISFSYTDEYVTSITQTWGTKSLKRKTWAIVNGAIRAKLVVDPLAAGGIMTKHIPTNAITPVYTDVMAASDGVLASIFGGPEAIAAANGFEPAGLANRYPLYRGDMIGDDGEILRGHLSYAMHLYGNEDGTAETDLFVPLGFISKTDEPTPTDAAVTFYYPKLGNLTNVTLAVFHVANFQLSYEGERVRIGNIGGPGGSIASYRHAHIEFYRGNTGLPSTASRMKLRIDPVTVFASTPVRALRFEETSARWFY